MSTPEQDAQMLKKQTRIAHETIQELKHTISEAREVIRALGKAAEIEIDTRLRPVVEENIKLLGEATTAAIVEAEERVDVRFDTMADIMLGEDKWTKRQGKLSIKQLIENKRALDRGEELPHDPDGT